MINGITLRIPDKQRITLSMPDKDGITLIIGNPSGKRYPTYEGAYTVVPAVESQTLETREKLMLDDVKVTEIPYAETSNIYGTTVVIAS